MPCLGLGYKVILLWHHPPTNCATISTSFCYPKEPTLSLKEGGQTGLQVGPGRAVGV